VSGPRPVASANHRLNGVVKVIAAHWKLGSATIGVGAVIAMGVLGAGFGNVGLTSPVNVLSPVAPQATEQTATTTTPPTAPVTSLASPTITASTPSGFAMAP
jgi:hypothetical protein